MRGVLGKFDFVISADESTLYGFVCVPTIAIFVADNQLLLARKLEKRRIVIGYD
jgi:spore coat polysaccharide biosynthesis predicted glycosyltransferase SpsG